MLKNLPVAKKLCVGSAVPLLLLLFLAFGASRLTSSLKERCRLIEAETFTISDVARKMQYDTVQIQQFLTDISATRAQDGLNDGYEEAAKAYDSFRLGLEKLREIFQRRQDQATLTNLAAIEKYLETYYQTGKDMAQAFIESGTSAGNRLMLPFDKAAEELTSKFDPFVEKQTQQLSQEMTAIGASLNWATSMIWAALLAALGISATVAFVIGRGITRPLGQTVKVLTAVATGDLTLHLEDSSQDEVGQMTQALNHAVTHMGEAVSTIAESASLLARASEELATTSRQITGSAETTAIESNVVSEIAVQVKEHVVAVTTAAEEMCACINRIAQRVNGTAEIVTQAVQEAESARAVIGKLEDSSKAIGQVVKVITAIAEQTNLLALNATIEAARAGEAGKGFAVVANEVKELAKQTAEATSGIGQQVVTIQADTHQAITAIGQIATVIGQINEMSMSISSAVEEQKATTDAIGRDVGQAYKGSAEIAELLSQKVVRSIRETVSNVQVVQQTSGELAHMATELQQLVSQFRYEGTGTASHTAAMPEQGEPTTVNGHAPGYTHEAGEVRI